MHREREREGETGRDRKKERGRERGEGRRETFAEGSVFADRMQVGFIYKINLEGLCVICLDSWGYVAESN